RRLVVDDVVDARRAALDRRDRGRGGVVHVYEGPGPLAAADHGQLPLADHLDLLAVAAERRRWPVEEAVAQDDPARRRERLALEVLDSGAHLAAGHADQRRVLRLRAGLERVGERDRLRDDLLRAGGL